MSLNVWSITVGGGTAGMLDMCFYSNPNTPEIVSHGASVPPQQKGSLLTDKHMSKEAYCPEQSVEAKPAGGCPTRVPDNTKPRACHLDQTLTQPPPEASLG